MWRLEGDWTFSNSPALAAAMQQLMLEKDPMQRIEDPTLIINLVLTDTENPVNKRYALAMIHEAGKLILREVVAPNALARYFPGHDIVE